MSPLMNKGRDRRRERGRSGARKRKIRKKLGIQKKILAGEFFGGKTRKRRREMRKLEINMKSISSDSRKLQKEPPKIENGQNGTRREIRRNKRPEHLVIVPTIRKRIEKLGAMFE